MLRLNLPTSDHGALPRRVLVRGGLCLGERGEAQRLGILIGGDTIEALIPLVSNLPDDCQVIEAEGFAIIPGLVNAHTHGHGGLSKGSGDRWTLELLLNAGSWLGGNRSDDELTTAELPRMIANCPASTAPPPTSPAC